MTDIVERINDIWANDDHERGCQGREYSCSCGFDNRTAKTAEDAATEITRLRQLLSEKWRPMNIAPLDGTEILIRTKDGCVSCAWDNTDQEWVAGWLGIALLKADPLGWMAIPKTEMHGDGE